MHLAPAYIENRIVEMVYELIGMAWMWLYTSNISNDIYENNTLWIMMTCRIENYFLLNKHTHTHTQSRLCMDLVKKSSEHCIYSDEEFNLAGVIFSIDPMD